jgi:hypothetical protein
MCTSRLWFLRVSVTHYCVIVDDVSDDWRNCCNRAVAAEAAAYFYVPHHDIIADYGRKWSGVQGSLLIQRGRKGGQQGSMQHHLPLSLRPLRHGSGGQVVVQAARQHLPLPFRHRTWGTVVRMAMKMPTVTVMMT